MASSVSTVIFYSLFNIVCAICIVLLNKWIYVHIQFPNLTLTLLHFISTFIGLVMCESFNLFQVKSVNLKDILPLAVSFCGFVIFTNLSLQFNTVGTYQLAKVLTTPTIVYAERIWHGKTFSSHIKYTLIAITAGVFIAVVTDLKFNAIGTIFAVVGVLITSVYQILVGEKQKEFQMNSMQLLYYQAPMSSVMLLVIVLFLEPPWQTFNHEWSLEDIGMVFGSCVIAFFLNLSIYWIIGQTSPLSYNMVGHLKFCLTTAGGYLFFQEPLSPLQTGGVMLTMLGLSLYGQIKLAEQSRSQRSLEQG